MQIDPNHPVSPGLLGQTGGKEEPRSTEKSFAEALQAESRARRQEILDRQPDKPGFKYADEVSAIKSDGMRAYVEALHIEKIKEMREKILERMGLTEEALEAMPADQRKTIEEMIAREIEARLAVNSLMNGTEHANDGKPGSGQLTAETMIAQSGKLPGGAEGAVLMAILDADNPTPTEIKEAETKAR